MVVESFLALGLIPCVIRDIYDLNEFLKDFGKYFSKWVEAPLLAFAIVVILIEPAFIGLWLKEPTLEGDGLKGGLAIGIGLRCFIGVLYHCWNCIAPWSEGEPRKNYEIGMACEGIGFLTIVVMAVIS